PQLYDLTTLQREANSRFGFSAKNTLGIAQALYEKHKVLTYPRTDSRYLPEDYIQQTQQVLSKFSQLDHTSPGFPEDLPKHAGHAVANNLIVPNKRIFNNAKVTDHFAISPTGEVPKGLKEQEMKIYDMVTRRFIAVFYPSAEYAVTQRITTIGQDQFKTDGKILMVPGWLAVYGKQAGVSSGKDGDLVAVEQGEDAKAALIEVLSKETKPPARYG
ncbi:MAG: DNA topoisomerase, partial [Verrucomicrobiales bacterium]